MCCKKHYNKDLKLKPFKRIKTSRKTKDVAQKRKTRSRKLLDKYSQNDVKHIVFTDEKDFTLEVPINTKNNVVYGRKKTEIPYVRFYFSAGWSHISYCK